MIIRRNVSYSIVSDRIILTTGRLCLILTPHSKFKRDLRTHTDISDVLHHSADRLATPFNFISNISLQQDMKYIRYIAIRNQEHMDAKVEMYLHDTTELNKTLTLFES